MFCKKLMQNRHPLHLFRQHSHSRFQILLWTSHGTFQSTEAAHDSTASHVNSATRIKLVVALSLTQTEAMVKILRRYQPLANGSMFWSLKHPLGLMAGRSFGRNLSSTVHSACHWICLQCLRKGNCMISWSWTSWRLESYTFSSIKQVKTWASRWGSSVNTNFNYMLFPNIQTHDRCNDLLLKLERKTEWIISFIHSSPLWLPCWCKLFRFVLSYSLDLVSFGYLCYHLCYAPSHFPSSSQALDPARSLLQSSGLAWFGPLSPALSFLFIHSYPHSWSRSPTRFMFPIFICFMFPIPDPCSEPRTPNPIPFHFASHSSCSISVSIIVSDPMPISHDPDMFSLILICSELHVCSSVWNRHRLSLLNSPLSHPNLPNLLNLCLSKLRTRECRVAKHQSLSRVLVEPCHWPSSSAAPESLGLPCSVSVRLRLLRSLTTYQFVVACTPHLYYHWMVACGWGWGKEQGNCGGKRGQTRLRLFCAREWAHGGV